MPRRLKRFLLILRRMVMNRLMGTHWYPALRYRFRKRATTGTGDMQGESFAAYVLNIFETYRKHLRGRVTDFQGMRVLEVGPGEHLGIGLLFIASGARQAVCIDRFREVRNASPDVQRMYAELRKLLPSEEAQTRFDSAFEKLDRPQQDPDNPIVYLPNLSLEGATPERLGRFDLIVSTSVLEHVTDLRADMRIMYDLLNPGGWIAHCVDLSSHDRYESYSLEFLETEEILWNLQFSNIGGPNRCRANDFRSYMEEAGFRDLYVHVDMRFANEAIERARPKLASKFRNLSDTDLSASVLFVCARKPAIG